MTGDVNARKPIVATAGEVNAGKSTLNSALTGDIVAPHSPLKLTSAVSEIRISNAKVGQCFGIRFTDGQEKEFPIDALWETMNTGQRIERFFLYAPPCVLLEAIRLIDLPGVQMDQDKKIFEFLRETPDIVVYVTTSASAASVGLSDATLPCQHVIVINKIDTDIDWEAPDLCLEQGVQTTEDRARECLQQQGTPPTEIAAASGLIALASLIWKDRVLQGVLRLAEPGNFEVLQKTTYFGAESTGALSVKDRHALLDEANVSLQGPWLAPEYCSPAWAALRFAVGLAVYQGIKCPDILRRAMRKISGIDRLRSMLLSLAQSDRITARQQNIEAVREAEVEIIGLHRARSHVRGLLEQTDHIATPVDALGCTEHQNYFADIRAHLQEQETDLSVRLRDKRQWLSGIRENYQKEQEDDAVSNSMDG